MLTVLLSVARAVRSAEKPPGIPASYQLQYEQAFNSLAWRHAKDGGNGALELFGKSDYKPKDRSPFNIALIADRVFSDFILDVELQSTVKPYGHQDMRLFYGFERRTNSTTRTSR